MKEKYFLPLISILILFFSCKVLSPKRFNSKYSLFSNNALLADQNYYTRAVMEYYLIKDVLGRFGKIKEYRYDPHNPINKKFYGNIQTVNVSTENLTINCEYKKPETLADLESGFQFRYYQFTGEARASMQAFGINDLDASKETTYLVIDYIQFKDISCSRLPTIRYAVGLRSELKINKVSSDFNFKGAQSLKNLAAQVELDQAEIFFSLKTIGITGFDARLNIPQGVSFDVTTYKDFQNSIEFIKKEYEPIATSEIDNLSIITNNDTLSNGNNLQLKNENAEKRLINRRVKVNISPEIIPVLDDYRINLHASLRPLVNEIKGLSKERRKINRTREVLINKQTKEKLNKLIDNEIDSLLSERKIYDSLNHVLTLKYPLKIVNETDKVQRALSRFRDNTSEESIQTFGDLFPHVDTLDKYLMTALEFIYILSDEITEFGYENFLNEIDKMKITDEQLQDIVEILSSIEEPNNNNLNSIINALNNDVDLKSLKAK